MKCSLARIDGDHVGLGFDEQDGVQISVSSDCSRYRPQSPEVVSGP
jgi:hypothetical protein